MARLRFTRVLTWLAMALPTAPALACTVCHSSAGQQLRAGLFDGHFGHTAALVAAPVPLLVLAVALLHWLMPAVQLQNRVAPFPRDARIEGGL